MADELKTQSVNVVLGPRGIEIDRSGSIRLTDPEILQAIITGTGIGDLAELAAEGNTALCNPNFYQCGKAIAERVVELEMRPSAGRAR